jgi:biopolymer transport protein ExbB/TolQ
MNINLLELWAQMGWPVRGVVIVLTLQAVASLTVALDRMIAIARSAAAARTFAAKAAPLVERGDFAALFQETSKGAPSHLAQLLYTGLKVYTERTAKGDSSERAADLARRAIERKGESQSDDLNRGLGVLASTGSTAPFVGLLGTVLGIINAFQMIAASGSGGIGTIGAAIGEALIVTGYGLCVAIPTVLVFNAITTRIQRFEMGLTNAGNELADRLETADPPSADAEEPEVAATVRREERDEPAPAMEIAQA